MNGKQIEEDACVYLALLLDVLAVSLGDQDRAPGDRAVRVVLVPPDLVRSGLDVVTLVGPTDTVASDSRLLRPVSHGAGRVSPSVLQVGRRVHRPVGPDDVARPSELVDVGDQLDLRR